MKRIDQLIELILFIIEGFFAVIFYVFIKIYQVAESILQDHDQKVKEKRNK